MGSVQDSGYFQHYESRFSSSLTFLFEDISFESRASLINRNTRKLIRTMTAELKVQIYIKRIQIRFIVQGRFDISYFDKYSVLTELRCIALYRNRYILPIVSETEAYYIRFFHAILERSRVHRYVLKHNNKYNSGSSFRTKAFKQFENEVWSIFYTIWREIPGGTGEPAWLISRFQVIRSDDARSITSI